MDDNQPVNFVEITDDIKNYLLKSSLGTELFAILSQNQFRCVYHPIVSLKSRKTYAFEALVRGPCSSSLHRPLNLFKVAEDHNCLFEADSLARVSSIKYFAKQLEKAGDSLLFLNISVNSVMSSLHQKGVTLNALKAYGVPPERVVIEITELQPVEDFNEFSQAINYYRELGFKVAIDDLGSGYNGLRIWSELKPDFVKIDRHFVSDIDTSSEKKSFMKTLVLLAKSLNTRIVAEGVETESELKCLESLDVDFVQGFLLKKPNKVIDLQLDYQWKNNSLVYKVNNEETVADIVLEYPSVSPTTLIQALTNKFLENKKIDFYPVVDGVKVLGVVWRRTLMDILAKRFGADIYARKSVEHIMDENALILDVNTSLVELSRRVTKEGGSSVGDAFIVTKNGQYLGCAKLNDLLRKITDLKVSNAQHANPLSGLPGNVPIQQNTRQLLDKNVAFELIYVDVDSFKAYNDFYSFEQGDDVIRLIANLLKEIVAKYRDKEEFSFIGHIGGDDFIIIMSGSSSYEAICKELLARFEKEIKGFYLPKDQEQGGISGLDREGKKQFFPIMSLSLGVLLAKPNKFNHTQQLAFYATKAKKMAKGIAGNSYYVLDTEK